MRSEERAGIVTVVMLFLWGTLIAEPFHIFARNIAKAVNYAFGGIGETGIISSLILYVVVVFAIILMQLMSHTKFGIYIPCAISVVFIALLILRTLHSSSVITGEAICLAALAVISIVLYLFKFDKGLTWLTDVYIYSLAVALINSLLFVPIARLGNVPAKILYITRYNDLRITDSFSGVAGIPELVWGLFLTAFAVLPIIFLATSGRRK